MKKLIFFCIVLTISHNIMTASASECPFRSEHRSAAVIHAESIVMRAFPDVQVPEVRHGAQHGALHVIQEYEKYEAALKWYQGVCAQSRVDRENHSVAVLYQRMMQDAASMMDEDDQARFQEVIDVTKQNLVAAQGQVDQSAREIAQAGIELRDATANLDRADKAFIAELQRTRKLASVSHGAIGCGAGVTIGVAGCLLVQFVAVLAGRVMAEAVSAQ